ncbi:hypothetical protein D515_01491 [Grimontia indica]|uniref:NadR/Ttd14 AAA domain-containing protein n=1 Tax=Grimontia indica TaxID=1056512 RepID=R1IQE6_9GAMM|nr:AAA family ATPase [Grimontia indica]EOD79697.1 hypothetical protein D515_01491 [Grimontia indica]
MNNLIVFTGGPGSGKTSVIESLKGQGQRCAPETGRKVIQQQVKRNGFALPWMNKVAFRDEMVREELANYDAFRQVSGPVFFDRCIIDCLGYSFLEELPIPESLSQTCQMLVYRKEAFIFPPWREIFVNDSERKQDFDKAVETYEVMVDVYQRFGYQLIEVPRLSVEERVRFVLEHIRTI